MIVASIDIRAFACPLTWVKTKIALDGLSPGEELEVLIGDGEPLQSVPLSAALEGHEVVTREPRNDGGWRLVLVKGRAADSTTGLAAGFEP